MQLAIGEACVTTCKALLQAGADPHISHFPLRLSVLHPQFQTLLMVVLLRTPFQMAWKTIFLAFVDQTTLHALRELFPDRENYSEECEFSELHKTVLGLSSRTLEASLAMCSSNIDCLDSFGNSALMWATQRNDVGTVRSLLNAGANPNIQTENGATALYYAAFYSNLPCIRLLVTRGAKFNLYDSRGYSPLHASGYHLERGQAPRKDRRESIFFLVAAGSDVNGKDEWGSTPLARSAINDLSIVAEALLDCGAEINSRDNAGDCAIHDALHHNSENVLRVLLERGADYTRWISTGNSIIHQAATTGSLNTIEILMNANLKNIDPDAKNRHGYTALELAQQREKRPDGFMQKLRLLLTGVRSRNARIALGIDGSSADKPTTANAPTEDMPPTQQNSTKTQYRGRHHSRNPFKWLRSLLQQRLGNFSSQVWSHLQTFPKTYYRARLQALLSIRTVLLVLCSAVLILWIHWIVQMRWMRLVVGAAWNVAGPGDFEL